MEPLLEGLLRSLGGSEANFLELCFRRFPCGNFHTKATSKKFRPPSGNFRPNPPPRTSEKSLQELFQSGDWLENSLSRHLPTPYTRVPPASSENPRPSFQSKSTCLGLSSSLSPTTETGEDNTKDIRYTNVAIRATICRSLQARSGPEAWQEAKKVSEESLWGSAKKSPKRPQNVKQKPTWNFGGYFLTFSGIFGDSFGTPNKTLSEMFLGGGIPGPEGPETPVNGRPGRKTNVHKTLSCALFLGKTLALPLAKKVSPTPLANLWWNFFEGPSRNHAGNFWWCVRSTLNV